MTLTPAPRPSSLRIERHAHAPDVLQPGIELGLAVADPQPELGQHPAHLAVRQRELVEQQVTVINHTARIAQGSSRPQDTGSEARSPALPRSTAYGPWQRPKPGVRGLRRAATRRHAFIKGCARLAGAGPPAWEAGLMGSIAFVDILGVFLVNSPPCSLSQGMRSQTGMITSCRFSEPVKP